MNKFTPSSLALAVAVALASQVASAEEESSSFALEEVIVTAQKREENLQEIPVSAQAFSAEDLRILGTDTVSELIYVAPSFNAGGLGGSQQVMGIRGIVDFSRNPGVDPRMGIYIDEVYQGQGYSADQPLLGLENVEILRGPQGTLFGKNTVSGAINLVTKKPTEDFEGQLSATYGNEGQVKAQAYFSGGLTDTLLGSLAVSYDQRDGLYRNTFLNQDTGDYDRISSRGKLLWVATDALDFTLSLDYTRRNSTEPTGTERAIPAFETRAGFEADDLVEFWGVGLHANYALDSGYDLVSITAYRDSKFVLTGDDDMLPFDIQISAFDEFNKQFTQELRIQSPSDGAFTWLAGLYYFNSDRSTGRRAIFGKDLYNILIPALAPFAERLTGYADVPSKVKNDSYAVFVHADWAITDRFSTTFGVRYTEDKKSVDWQQVNHPDDPEFAASINPAFAQIPGIFFGAINREYEGDRKEHDTAPTIALNYQVNDETMTYIRYGKAAKSGGYNADFMLLGLDYFEYDQESMHSYELGLKSTMFDDRVRLNLAGFKMDFKDYQVFQFVERPGTTPTVELTNAGKVSVDGVEMELTWVPIDNLRFVANSTWLDATYDVYLNPTGQDYAGNSLPYAPELKYFLGAQYMLQLASGTITFDLDYTSVSRQFTDPGNLAVDTIDSYNLVNARVAYTPQNGNWELALWGRNLGDEEYARTNSDNFLGTPRVNWGEPLLYGVTYTYFLGN